MNIIKKIFIALLVLCVLAIAALFVMVKTVDLNRFKTQIVSKISQELDMDVQLKDIDLNLSWNEGASLNIKGFLLQEKTKEAGDLIGEVNKIKLIVDTKALILHKQVLVKRVLIDRPVMKIHHLNTQVEKETSESVSVERADTHMKVSGKKEVIRKKEPAVVPEPLPDFTVENIHLNHGSVEYLGGSGSDIFKVVLDNVNVMIPRFALKDPFDFNLDASLWSDVPNIHLGARVKMNEDFNGVRLNDGSFTTDFSKLDIGRLMKDMPMLSPATFEDNIKGKFTIDLETLNFQQGEITELLVKGELADGYFKLKDWDFPVDMKSMSFFISDGDLRLNKFQWGIASGNVSGRAELKDAFDKQKLSFQLSADRLLLSELINKEKLPFIVEGYFVAKLNGSNEGFKTKTLLVDGVWEIKEGKLIDMNILKLALNRFTIIPGFAENIQNSLPEKYREILTQQDTELDKVRLNIHIENKVAYFNPVHIAVEGCEIRGKVDVSFEHVMNSQLSLFLAKDLSDKLVEDVPELSALLTDHKQIQILFQNYHGPLDKFQLIPDIGDLGKDILRTRGKQELRKLIFDGLGIESEKQKETGTADPNSLQEGEEANTQEKRSGEQELIDHALDSIFNQFLK